VSNSQHWREAVIKRDRTGRESEFLTPEEVAEILRINVMTVYGYIQKDSLDAIRLGRNYRISSKDLASFIKSKRTKTRLTDKNMQLI
jgi:excisionase family DNA binding protein